MYYNIPMDYLPLLPTYLHTFQTEFLPRPINLKDLATLITTVSLFTLKKKGALLIQGNGVVTFLKKVKDGGDSNLEMFLLKQVDVNSVNLVEVVKKIGSAKIMDLVRADLIAGEVLIPKKNLLGKEELKPSPAKVTLLASQLPQVKEELEKLKSDHLFLEVFSQTKKAMS